jgi:hypothetical protein
VGHDGHRSIIEHSEKKSEEVVRHRIRLRLRWTSVGRRSIMPFQTARVWS